MATLRSSPAGGLASPADMADIGVIGGSGLYSFLTDARPVEVSHAEVLDGQRLPFDLP